MSNVSRYLFLAQILIFVGALTTFYKIGDSLDLKNKQQVANVTFKSIENEYQRQLFNSKSIMQYWSNEVLTLKDPEKYCHSPVVKMLEDNDMYINYGVADLKGNVLCSKLPFPDDYNLNKITPKYQEVLDDKEFGITSSGFSTTTKEARIGVGYPVIDNKGKVKLGLFLSIRLKKVNEYITSLHLPESSELLITDRTGNVIVVYPTQNELLGKQKFDAKTYSLILSEKSGQISYKDSTNRNMLYTYSPFIINEDKDNVEFILYGIQRGEKIFEIPDSLTRIQLVLLATSIGLLTYVIFKQIKRKQKK